MKTSSNDLLIPVAIVDNQRRIFPVCSYLNGQYGLKDVYLGVPVILGKNGVEEIIQIELNEEEQKLLNESAKAVKDVANVLDSLNIFE